MPAGWEDVDRVLMEVLTGATGELELVGAEPLGLGAVPEVALVELQKL